MRAHQGLLCKKSVLGLFGSKGALVERDCSMFSRAQHMARLRMLPRAGARLRGLWAARDGFHPGRQMRLATQPLQHRAFENEFYTKVRKGGLWSIYPNIEAQW